MDDNNKPSSYYVLKEPQSVPVSKNNANDANAASTAAKDDAGDLLMSKIPIDEDWEVAYMVGEFGMFHFNSYLDVSTSWAVFRLPVMCDECSESETGEMIIQGPSYCLQLFKAGSIVDKYAWDGLLSSGIRVLLTATWFWRLHFTCYDEDLVIYCERSRMKSHAEF